MNALVVGCGKVGSEIARDLASSNEISSVTALDAAKANLDRMRGVEKVTRVKGSIGQRRVLKVLMENADFVCGALPGRIGFELLEHAVEAGKNIVDISYTPKNPILLHRKALSNNCIVVPQCGVAPGLTNMCVGDASRRMDKIGTVRIFVGGLPQKPRPPLNYRVVFSLDDVINEYTRPVRVIENGKGRIVEPLSGRGFLSFPGVGKLEYFLTDGLGTLPDSFPETRNMHELTLRYPGHAEIIDTLRLVGFFSNKPISVENHALEPRAFSLEVLRRALADESPEDFLALSVEVDGVLQGRRTQMNYRVLDWFDRKRQVSAMARTTAYPCTSVALLMARGMVSQRGVVPPERIARDPKLFRFVVSRLRKHGVRLVTQLKRMNP